MANVTGVGLVTLIFLLGALVPVVQSLPTSSGTSSVTGAGAVVMQAAETALGQGKGPAQGQALTCSSVGTLSAACAPGHGGAARPGANTGWEQVCGYKQCPLAARGAAGMTYDPETGYVVLFGGIVNLTLAANTTFNDTWIFQDGTWTPLHIPGPSARLGAYVAYDYSDHYVLLFGGGPYLTLNGSLYDSDTWEFQNGTWTELYPAVHPSARGLGGIAWDATDGYLIIYGGMSSQYNIHSDTWTYRDGQWQNLSLAVHPPALLSPGMTYDPAEHYVLLFGGATCPSCSEFGLDIEQTWSFANGAWSNLTGSIHGKVPDGRILFSMAWDPAQNFVVLFGGWNTTTLALYGDTWIFLDGFWSQLFLSPTPAPAMIGGSLINTTANAGLLLFGGVVGTYTGYWGTNATWVFGPPPANTSTVVVPPTTYPVTFHTVPASCGAVLFNSTEMGNGSSVHLTVGQYNMSVPPCHGYTFSRWYWAGDVDLVGPQAQSTNGLVVNGAGNLTAFFAPASAAHYRTLPVDALVALVGIIALAVAGVYAYLRLSARRLPPPP